MNADDIYIVVYEKLSQLQWAMKRHQMFNQAKFGPFADSTRGQGRILAMLKIQPDIATSDLAYLLGIRQQSLNELLNKLEKGGYVERKPYEDDKRVMIVHLTEKGKNAKQPDTSYKEFFSCLSYEELLQFSEYLERILAAFGEKADSKEDMTSDWMDKARERMGNEHFEQLISMRERAFGSFRRGNAPTMPGAERFSPDYDGPVPDRDDFDLFGDRRKK